MFGSWRGVRRGVVEQYLFNLSRPAEDLGEVRVQPNLWLLTADEMPPLLFSCEEVARLLHVGRSRVYELIRRRELRSVRIGVTRRVSAKALAEYVAGLDSEVAG